MALFGRNNPLSPRGTSDSSCCRLPGICRSCTPHGNTGSGRSQAAEQEVPQSARDVLPCSHTHQQWDRRGTLPVLSLN